MKNVKIPEEVYVRLTKFKGKLTTKTGKNTSYGDAITYLLDVQETPNVNTPNVKQNCEDTT